VVHVLLRFCPLFCTCAHTHAPTARAACLGGYIYQLAPPSVDFTIALPLTLEQVNKADDNVTSKQFALRHAVARALAIDVARVSFLNATIIVDPAVNSDTPPAPSANSTNSNSNKANSTNGNSGNSTSTPTPSNNPAPQVNARVKAAFRITSATLDEQMDLLMAFQNFQSGVTALTLTNFAPGAPPDGTNTTFNATAAGGGVRVGRKQWTTSAVGSATADATKAALLRMGVLADSASASDSSSSARVAVTDINYVAIPAALEYHSCPFPDACLVTSCFFVPLLECLFVARAGGYVIDLLFVSQLVGGDF
jgi:hypothetical protein